MIIVFFVNSDAVTAQNNIDNLPEPVLSGDIVLEDVLGFEPTMTNDDFPHGSIEDISQLMYAAQGITHFPFRSVPSAGGTYPLDVYVLANDISSSGIVGLNHYEPFYHELTRSLNVEYLELSHTFQNSLEQGEVNDTLFTFIITAEFSRTTKKYGDRGIGYVELEVGHLIQNVRVQARALKYQMIEIYDFDSDLVKDIFHLEYEPMVLLFFKAYQNRTSAYKVNSYKLPTLDLSQKGVSVEEAIYNRKSIRDYSSGPMAKSKLTSLIEYSFYRRDPFTSNLVFPSIPGNLPLETVLSVTDVNGLQNGLYRFDHQIRDFDLISNDSRRTEIFERSLEQQWVLEAQVVLIFIVNQTKLGESQYQQNIHEKLGNYELGTIAQNIYLEAYSLNLGAVVVGAFSDSGIRAAVFAEHEMLPLYVIPVGVIPEGYYQSIHFLSMVWFESIFAWIAIIFFYLSCIIMTPPLKRGLRRGAKWFHLVLGIFALLAGITHVILYHGGIYLISSPNSDRVFRLVKSVMFSFPNIDTNSPFEIGLILARISVWAFLVFAVIALISLFRSTNITVKQYLLPLHKYIGYTYILMIGLHILMNSYWLSVFGVLIYFILIVTAALYLLLHNWMRISTYFTLRDSSRNH